MQARRGPITTDDALKAAAGILGVPADVLAGYVVIGLHPDGAVTLSGNIAHAAGMAAIISKALTDLLYELADSIPIDAGP